MEPSDAKIIADWAKKGGQVIVMDVPEFESVEGTPETEQILFGKKGSDHRKIGKGQIVRVSGWEGLSAKLRTTLVDLRLPACDLTEDDVFATWIGEDRWLILNTAEQDSEIRILLPDTEYSIPIKQGTITEIILNKD